MASITLALCSVRFASFKADIEPDSEQFEQFRGNVGMPVEAQGDVFL
jgi:hypothetical protein